MQQLDERTVVFRTRYTAERYAELAAAVSEAQTTSSAYLTNPCASTLLAKQTAVGRSKLALEAFAEALAADEASRLTVEWLTGERASETVGVPA